MFSTKGRLNAIADILRVFAVIALLVVWALVLNTCIDVVQASVSTYNGGMNDALQSIK